MKESKNIEQNLDKSNEKLHISDVSDSKISKLIDKKLNDVKLTDEEFLQLHNWMIENDDDYRNSVDTQMKKDLKKCVPKGTEIK